jgi:hypothetical protein
MGYMLLPFSYDIDAAAIEQAITLAYDYNATLVPFSIIPLSGRHHTVRLEHIQQAKDFQILTKQKATRAGVPVETLERYTSEEVQVIRSVALELQCTGILLFARQQKGILLSATTIRQLMQTSKSPCFLSLLPPQRNFMLTIRDSFNMVCDAMKSRAVVAHT